MSKRTLIVDYSATMYYSWWQMFSPNYVPKMETEIEEYTYNFTKNLFYIQCRFKPDEIIFAMDHDDNWRAHFVKEWYDSRTFLCKDLDETLKNTTYYTKIDDTVWKFEKYLQTMQWQKTKVKACDVKSLDFSDETRFLRFDDVDSIKQTEVWKQCMSTVTKYYKGQRKLSEWKCKTDKAEWKRVSIDLAPKIASLLGASVIRVPLAEGDDIVAIATMEACSEPDNQVICVSVDQDLYQLSTMHPNFHYYNPTKHKVVSLTPEDARWKLICKIVGGDSSDNISGVSIGGSNFGDVSFTEDGQVKNGKKTASFVQSLIKHNLDKGLTGTKLYRSAYEYLEKHCDDDTFHKNLVLVYLKNIPEEIQDEIREALLYRKPSKTKWKFIDAGIDIKTKILLMNRATEDAKEDEL